MKDPLTLHWNLGVTLRDQFSVKASQVTLA